MTALTSADRLEAARAQTDTLAVDDTGVLSIDGCTVVELLSRYGSPLFVISENTLRANYRRVKKAFSTCWPAETNIMYAIKANHDLAVRAIFHDEGAGGDCFSTGEIHATFTGGADPALIALNGPNKSMDALVQAVQRGMCVNLDSLEELQILSDIARAENTVCRVAIRLRLQSPDFDSAVRQGLPDINAVLRTRENGLSLAAAEQIVAQVRQTQALQLEGYHFHLGRESRDPRVQAVWAKVLASHIVDLHRRTGYWPDVIDVGGGLAREREPEAGSEGLMNPYSVEDYAEAITTSLLAGLSKTGNPIPALWLEPGRYLAGNAGVLLATVGIVKADVGRRWIHVDASINDLPRIDLYRWNYVALAAGRMRDEETMHASIVGSLCTGAPLAPVAPMPPLVRGDIVAFLDAGHYAEVASTQYNAIPRPATVLVGGARSAVIKRRETIADIFGTHVIPHHVRHGAASHQPTG
jgi:diaminopimelate decarboxylase